jgi:CBS domain-containing protein
MRCEELMKRHVERVSPSDSLRTAAQKMREHNIGFLPVCDSAGRVLGVLTDRDIVVRACAVGRDIERTPVEVVMSPDVISCRPTQTVRHAEELMMTTRRSRIVVTDPGGTLLGVISLSDIAQYETPSRTADTLQGITSRKYDPSSGLG